MNILDMRTLVLNQIIIYALCTGVVALLWRQNRRRFAGLVFWLANFLMQTVALVLLILRGPVPLWVSAIGTNALIWGGTVLLYVGLERFVEKRSKQIHTGVPLAVLVAVHGYFTLIQPDLAIRNINTSVGLVIFSLLIAWLMLRRVGTAMRPMTRMVGWMFVGFALVSVGRILVNIAIPPGDDFFQTVGLFDMLLILAYQILFFGVTFSLYLMINKRLFLELEIQQTTLQQSEARYRHLVELSPEAIVVYHNDTIDFVNSAAVALMGAAHAGDLLGRNIFEFLHPDYHAVARERVARVLAQGEPAPLLEQKLVRLDGSIVDVEITTALLEHQGQPALQTIVRDVAERKQAEDVIRLRLRLFEFAADHSLDELMQKALDEIGELTSSPIGFYHFVEADQKMLSLQAWSTRTLQEFCQAEGKGMHYSIDQAGVWVDCVHQRKPVIHNDYAALPHRKGMPPGHAEIKRELVVPTMREGRIVSILGVGNKPVDYHEKDVELVAYVADVVWSIVERKRAEVELRRYAEQLALQNAELDAFAHTVAHDLKNPLGIALGYAKLLEKEYADLSSNDLQESLHTIVRYGKKLDTIIDELLLLASVRKEEVSHTPLKMAEIVQEVCRRLQETEQVQVHISMPEPSVWPVAIGYAPWVEEVWANYINNAIKYGGNPPHIDIGWEVLAPDTPASFIRFWVRDGGPGLTPEAQSKLFAPFTRLGQARVQGHGLGLSIVQRIVEKLGGEVGVESAPGCGSTFFFTLPVADSAVAQ